MSSARSLRIMKEMAALTADPPPGITCWNGPEDMFQIHAGTVNREGEVEGEGDGPGLDTSNLGS